MDEAGKGSAEGPIDGYVEFLVTGQRAKGEYHCTGCGYGVTVFSLLPQCPMCAGTAWEQSSWSPISRAVERG
jgi:lipopolysaccharide biosynthesis regulator YciM